MRAVRFRPAAAGYNLVALVIGIAVLNILLAAVLPLWSHVIKRDKEEELISRGLQYAEAIRVFQKRFGRYPVRLEELLEVKPRCIRQLWKDPVRDSKRWGLLYANVGRPGGPGVPAPQPQPPTGRKPVPSAEEEKEGEGEPGDEEDEEAEDEDAEELPPPTGPIVGVHSRSKEESIKTFFDRQRYDQWQFTVQLLTSPVGLPGRPDLPRLNPLTRSRPFRGIAAPGSPGAGAAPGQPRLPGSPSGTGAQRPRGN